MSVITSIKPQKNVKRVNIYLDDKFGFGLDLESFVKLGLKVEQELTEEEIAKIVKKAEFRKVYDKLLKFATLRPRSGKEFKDWVKKHKIHKTLHVKLFNRLKRLNLLNDRNFAKWWVEQREQFRPKSKRILNYELRNKGIKKEMIADVLEEAQVDEVAMARMLLEKKKYKWKKLSKLEAKRKMSQFLFQHGFDWEVIRKVLDTIDEIE